MKIDTSTSPDRHDVPLHRSVWEVRAPVRVLLVEDHAAFAHRLTTGLNRQPDVHVCATADNGHDALALMRRLRPEVCLVSASIGFAVALTLTDRLTRVPRPPRVLVYVDGLEPVVCGAARLAGADGVIARDAEPQQVARSLTALVDGAPNRPRPGRSTLRQVADLVDEPDRPTVTMLLLGVHPDEIARTVGISARALRSRRRRLIYQFDEVLALRRRGFVARAA